MSAAGVSMLDLPSVRGNPFDNRPIEASRAHDLVGRQKILHRWRDHILSGSPRMILLVGEPGSGRTSMINTISSQTPKKYIGQFLSDDDDQVRTVLHEIVTHFGSFQPIPTMNQLSQKLVSILDEEKGPLPLIALDYPSRATDINIFLSRISPILSRLRAMIIVTITESQLLELDLELKEMFDEPERIPNFTKKEIQEMVNNRMRIKSKEKWNINSKILESIHSSTGGNPREVIKILKCLVDEKRELGYDGTLENLMAWQNQTPPSTESTVISPPSTTEENKVEITPIINFETNKIDELIEDDDDFIVDEEPLDMWDEDDDNDDDEDPIWSESFSFEDNIESPVEDTNIIDVNLHHRISELKEEENVDSIPSTEPLIPKINSEPILETELFMQPGTEPPKSSISGGAFGGLRARLAKTSSDMIENEISDVPITYADTPQSQPTLDRFVDSHKVVQDKKTIAELPNYSNASFDSNVEPSNYDRVMSDEGAEWSVAPPFSSTLPESSFESDVIPSNSDSEYRDPIQSEATFFEEFNEPEEIIQPVSANSHELSSIPTDKLIPNFSNFEPRWDPDRPLDTARFYLLSDAERLILQISSIREISPSDDELQARLEVGRPRLSQLYNSLHKSGLLSVRKQGRTRLFKLSNAAAEEF